MLIDDEVAFAAMDRQEQDYHHKPVPVRTPAREKLPPLAGTFLYVSNAPGPATEEFPVMRSYADCVIAGYLRTFGYDGAKRFLDSTEGWDSPWVDDRERPRHPRAVTLTTDEQGAIESLLTAIRAFDRRRLIV